LLETLADIKLGKSYGIMEGLGNEESGFGGQLGASKSKYKINICCFSRGA
jgi:hypothetical protein